MLALAERVFALIPFVPSFVPSLSPLFFAFALRFCFILEPSGVMGAMMSVWTSYNHQVADRLGNNAPDPLLVAFGAQFGCGPDAVWVVSSALFFASFFLSSFLYWVWGRWWRYGRHYRQKQ